MEGEFIMEKKCILSSFIVVLLFFSSIPLVSEGSDNRTRTNGNESFETATEIAADGSTYSGNLDHDSGDFLDYLKYYLVPPAGKCINATINVSAVSATHTFFVGVYSPDRIHLHFGMVQQGGQPMSFSFWAGTEDYYYISVGTFNNTATYHARVDTAVVDHPPDGNNNVTEAQIVSANNTYKGRVNMTTDCYDIYRLNLNSNQTHGDGLNVHLSNFTDVNLEVYDMNGILRDESSLISSTDPTKGETVRFVANQTGAYYIVAAFEIIFPEGSYANYNLTVNVTPNKPHDEDWSMEKATPTDLGIHNGSFDSTFDIFDYYSIELNEGDDVNISALVTDADDWSLGIQIFNETEEDLSTSSYGGSDYEGIEEIRIPEDGTYYIEFENQDLTVFDYMFFITVNGKNFRDYRPVSLNRSSDELITPEDTPATYELASVFNRGEPRTFECINNGTREGENLTVECDQNGLVTVTPKANWSGNGTVLMFRCTDNFNFFMDFTLNVNVTSVNDRPFFEDIAGVPMPAIFWIYAVENEWSNFTVNVTDADNSSGDLNISVVSGGSNLIYNSTDGLFHYFTDDGSLPVETFTVSVSDGLLEDTQTIKVDITDVNDPPVARPIRLVSGGDRDLTVNLATDPAYDEEGITLTCLWFFGDGEDTIGFDLYSVAHTYAKAGVYLVQLEVNDTVYVDKVFLEINVTAPNGTIEPQWYDDLETKPVGTDETLDINITTAKVTDKVVSKSGYRSTINCTYDITGTSGTGVDEIYLYYGTENPFSASVNWKPIHEEKAIITPTGGSWALNITIKIELSYFDGVDWMGILAMAWGSEGYDVDRTEANYTFIDLEVDEDDDDDDDEEINTSLWKNLTKSYTDEEKDDLYSSSTFMDEVIEFGKRPELDIIKLDSRLDGTSLLVELTFRGAPVEYEEIDWEDLFTAANYDYTVYFVGAEFEEPKYPSDNFEDDTMSMFEPDALFNIWLVYPAPNYFFTQGYTVSIIGNTISWEIPLTYLMDKGMDHTSDFELFARASMSQMSEDMDKFYDGYDSVGFGAYSPDTSAGSGGEGSGSKMGTGVIIFGAIGILAIIAVIIIVIVVSKKKKGKKDTGDAPAAASPALDPEEEVNKLIEEARNLGMRVVGFEDDLENAITYLADDAAARNESLKNIYMRIRGEINREKGIPETPPAAAPTAPAGGPTDETAPLTAPVEIPQEEMASPTPVEMPQEDAPAQQPGQADIQPPICTVCNASSVYYPEYDCFWCEACQDYVTQDDLTWS